MRAAHQRLGLYVDMMISMRPIRAAIQALTTRRPENTSLENIFLARVPWSRRQRRWVLAALALLSLLAVQSCGLDVQPESHTPPCDTFAAAQTPCVAAFSTVRALSSSYKGLLYQVTRASDSTTTNVGLLSDGYADAAVQDKFCADTTCTITTLFDQTTHHNDLTAAPPGSAAKGEGPGGSDLPALADSLPITAGGHKVYGVYISAGMGYRNEDTSGIAVNGQPEGVYMVASGTHIDNGCCFDFGNAEKDAHNNGQGHMDAISLKCDGSCTPINPNVGLDMEDGIYPPFPVPAGIPFVTAMGANDGQHNYAVYWGDAQTGILLTTGRLSLPKGNYSPMHQEGAIILGIGGDNSNWSIGSFFEGAMTAGAPPAKNMFQVQANVASVGYKNSK